MVAWRLGGAEAIAPTELAAGSERDIRPVQAPSYARLNVHFHSLVLDGVYVRDAGGELRFHALPSPSPEQVADVARWTHEQLVRVCERHGRSLDEFDDATDELAQDQPLRLVRRSPTSVA